LEEKEFREIGEVEGREILAEPWILFIDNTQKWKKQVP
jgi:hypothetical protein